MLNISDKSRIFPSEVNGKNKFQIIELKPEEFDGLVSALVDLLPSHYIAPESIADILNRLGKVAAAQKLIDKIPEVKKIRSAANTNILQVYYWGAESTPFNLQSDYLDDLF